MKGFLINKGLLVKKGLLSISKGLSIGRGFAGITDLIPYQVTEGNYQTIEGVYLVRK